MTNSESDMTESRSQSGIDSILKNAPPGEPRPTPLREVEAEQMGSTPGDIWAEQYRAVLYRYAYRLTGNAHDADDLTQQGILAARQHWHQLSDQRKIEAWLHRIVRNQFIDNLRKKRPHLFADAETLPVAATIPTPPDGEIDEATLHHAIQSLPEPYRVVILMFYFEQASYQQIAAELAIPPGTVMSRLSRAKGHLRKMLAPQDSLVSRQDAGDRRRHATESPPDSGQRRQHGRGTHNVGPPPGGTLPDA